MANYINKKNEIISILESMNYSEIPDVIEDEDKIPNSYKDYSFILNPVKAEKELFAGECTLDTYNFELIIFYYTKTSDGKHNKFVNFLDVVKALNITEDENTFSKIDGKSYHFKAVTNFTR